MDHLSKLFFYVILLLPHIASANLNLHQQSLKNLTDNSLYTTQRLKGHSSLWLIFQPECRWCRPQAKSIRSAQISCNIQALAVGTGAGRRRLQQELTHLNPSFPAVEANSQLKTELGQPIPSPLTLAIHEDGSIAGIIRGYLPPNALRAKLLELNLCNNNPD